MLYPIFAIILCHDLTTSHLYVYIYRVNDPCSSKTHIIHPNSLNLVPLELCRNETDQLNDSYSISSIMFHTLLNVFPTMVPPALGSPDVNSRVDCIYTQLTGSPGRHILDHLLSHVNCIATLYHRWRMLHLVGLDSCSCLLGEALFPFGLSLDSVDDGL
ncbi:hypothetical protein ASPWEDRAFT_436373 [Aspergillus wentii DTO 134E9]|uniref:Uncharacterized protein n=1 Tax=Aspergillus wentii DTO 134E9 TaxID=1073089 RepID=A0A1L9RPQ2_ASPWE|nr:uncharacterized protein ASPWEDRAFT_436373 [Aspergillus wentii DTO 134E9]OJJ36935.1 hypothetical protein ASPWEDRAFT_436373 [Aspergillus wentii DTO 134E9]